jgi:hypothetical protein
MPDNVVMNFLAQQKDNALSFISPIKTLLPQILKEKLSLPK